jgi:hypothetical membrane protein
MSQRAANRPILEVHPKGEVLGQDAARGSPEPRATWPRVVFVAACVIAISSGLVMLHDAHLASHVHRGGLITGVLAAISLVATLTYLAIMSVLHVLPTGYSPVRHAVSDYGVGKYRSLFTVALCVSSVAVLTLAFALLRGVGSPPLATRDLAYLLLIPLARIGMTLFPTSLEGQRISRRGLVHYVCAIAAFTLTYLVISGTTPALRALDLSGWARTPLAVADWTVAPALALVVVTMFRPARKLFGLFERIFLLTTNIWVALAAGLLLSRLS